MSPFYDETFPLPRTDYNFPPDAFLQIPPFQTKSRALVAPLSFGYVTNEQLLLISINDLNCVVSTNISPE
jgi:hypothetical protein